MPVRRSRLGCEECRKRRRKCDEAKPACGPCKTFRRKCSYTLKIVWGAQTVEPGPVPRRLNTVPQFAENNIDIDTETTAEADQAVDIFASTIDPLALSQLPNGVPLSPPYRRLLDYFARDILASLSVHPAIHRDLAQGLVPAMLHEPHLLSAGLALAAAGLASRGLSDVGGVELPRLIDHLRTSGLSLLRNALQQGGPESGRDSSRDSGLVATCLLWCLADVFALSSSSSPSSAATCSWRIHLQGIQALLGGAGELDAFVTRAGESSDSSRSAMRHLYLLYLSLQTLPHVAQQRRQSQLPLAAQQDNDYAQFSEATSKRKSTTVAVTMDTDMGMSTGKMQPRIDGFLGYSEELLDILQQVEQLALTLPDSTDMSLIMTGGLDDIDIDHADSMDAPHLIGTIRDAAHQLLYRAQAQALVADDDSGTTPSIPITRIPAPALTAAAGREFALCHGCFQQATLIHVYRRLFRLPSRAALIQDAVAQIRRMAGQMTQGAPCSTWVAMALPLFTAGCEVYAPGPQAWAHAALDAFAASIGSRHVQVLRRALEDIWRLRTRRGDTDGRLCAGPLLDELNYNIILF